MISIFDRKDHGFRDLRNPLRGLSMGRLVSLLYLRKNLSQRDWDSYLEVYGIPSIFLVGPPNAGKDMEEEYQRIAEALISDGRGYGGYGDECGIDFESGVCVAGGWVVPHCAAGGVSAPGGGDRAGGG